MSEVASVLKHWDPILAFAAVIICASIPAIVLCSIVKYLVILLRGWPPAKISEIKRHSCDDDRNTTGKCLKIDGCKTSGECSHVMDWQDAKFNSDKK